MNYTQHIKFNLILASLISALLLYTKVLNTYSILLLFIGLLPYSTIITNDLDSSKSVVTRLWRKLFLGFIFKPFVDAGHREILHSVTWSPFILITPLWLLLEHFGVDVPNECILGAVLGLEGHILADFIYSGVKEVNKNWFVKMVREVF